MVRVHCDPPGRKPEWGCRKRKRKAERPSKRRNPKGKNLRRRGIGKTKVRKRKASRKDPKGKSLKRFRKDENPKGTPNKV